MFIFDFSKIIYRYLLSDACFFVIPGHFTVMADLIGHPSSLVLTRHARLRPGISLIPSKASIPSMGWNNTIHVIVATIFDFHLWQSMKLYNFTKILELCVRLSSTTYIKKNG